MFSKVFFPRVVIGRSGLHGKEIVWYADVIFTYWLYLALSLAVMDSLPSQDKFSLWKIFSSTDHRPESLCHGQLSVTRPSVCACVCALTFSLNIFFSETTYRILMKFHRNVPAIVLFRFLERI